MIGALPSVSSSADLLDRLGRLLVVAIPALFLIGRAPADIALSLIAILLLVRSALGRDWSWLRTPWVGVGLAIWLYLIVVSALAEDPGAAYSRALPFGRFVLFGAALQHWLLVERRTRRMLLIVLAGGHRLRRARHPAAVRDRPGRLRPDLRGEAPDRPLRPHRARHLHRQDLLPGARLRLCPRGRLAAALALRADRRADRAARRHGGGDRRAHRAGEPRARRPGVLPPAARAPPAIAARRRRRPGAGRRHGGAEPGPHQAPDRPHRLRSRRLLGQALRRAVPAQRHDLADRAGHRRGPQELPPDLRQRPLQALGAGRGPLLHSPAPDLPRVAGRDRGDRFSWICCSAGALGPRSHLGPEEDRCPRLPDRGRRVRGADRVPVAAPLEHELLLELERHPVLADARPRAGALRPRPALRPDHRRHPDCRLGSARFGLEIEPGAAENDASPREGRLRRRAAGCARSSRKRRGGRGCGASPRAAGAR